MWRAQFNDGTVVNEIETVDGIEGVNAFSRVLKNIDTLESLSIVQKTREFTVCMKDGKFTIIVSGIPFDFYSTSRDLMNTHITNIRPIYFVRETVEFSEGFKTCQGSVPSIQFTALGFQGNIGDTNIKRYLAILPDGTFTIEDK